MNTERHPRGIVNPLVNTIIHLSPETELEQSEQEFQADFKFWKSVLLIVYGSKCMLYFLVSLRLRVFISPFPSRTNLFSFIYLLFITQSSWLVSITTITTRMPQLFALAKTEVRYLYYIKYAVLLALLAVR